MNKTYSISSVEMGRNSGKKFSHVTTRGLLMDQNDVTLINQSVTEFPMLECSSDSQKHHADTRKLRNLKPKLTSSTLSLLKADNCNQSMSFNVDFASTPKRVMVRSSTPRAKPKKNMLTSTVIEKPKMLKKNIKSIQSIDSANKRIKRVKPLRISDFISSTGISNEINIDQINKIGAGLKSCHDLNCQERELNQWKKLKYPIKYYPHMKVKDIDRLSQCNMGDAQLSCGSFECNMRPMVNNCYVYGEYKFWIV